MLQDVLNSWQEYRDEERRLSMWLTEKETQIDDIKHIDLGDVEEIRKTLKMVMVRNLCISVVVVAVVIVVIIVVGILWTPTLIWFLLHAFFFSLCCFISFSLLLFAQDSTPSRLCCVKTQLYQLQSNCTSLSSCDFVHKLPLCVIAFLLRGALLSLFQLCLFCQSIEQEMEAQQATFGTFNLAAERVAENLDENSQGVTNIQEKMEEFNDRWNTITTEVSNRISTVSK